jgi:hypothetical protein
MKTGKNRLIINYLTKHIGLTSGFYPVEHGGCAIEDDVKMQLDG